MPHPRTKSTLTIADIAVDRDAFARMFTPSSDGLPADTWYDLLAAYDRGMSSKKPRSPHIPDELVPAPDTLYVDGSPLTRAEFFGTFPPAQDGADQRRRDAAWDILALAFEERRHQKYEQVPDSQDLEQTAHNKASAQALLQSALVEASRRELIDAALAVGLENLEAAWADLREAGDPAAAAVAHRTQAILDELRAAWDQAGLDEPADEA
ncbi:MAG: hypothetical protein KGJ03_11430 [Betaproteobacteria bacterium]|nr:hypothetical protein [Betaproteobacteria bacterium]MDE1956323.1 hypothetical protein [Betaproteobacteria bacterium]MDE2153248.1 hypothetical protein [Betaproteobacteria bacterium]